MAVINTHIPAVVPRMMFQLGSQESSHRERSGSAERSTGGKNHSVLARCMGLAGGISTTVWGAAAVCQPRRRFMALRAVFALPKST